MVMARPVSVCVSVASLASKFRVDEINEGRVFNDATNAATNASFCASDMASNVEPPVGNVITSDDAAGGVVVVVLLLVMVVLVVMVGVGVVDGVVNARHT